MKRTPQPSELDKRRKHYEALDEALRLPKGASIKAFVQELGTSSQLLPNWLYLKTNDSAKES